FSGDGDLLSASTAGTSISLTSFGPDVLQLSGADTLTHYQQVLQSVTFLAGDNPTDYGSNPTRTVTWVLDDGAASNYFSTAKTTSISITAVNDPPTLSHAVATISISASHAVTLSPALSIIDPDSLELASATVSVSGGTFSGDGDVLAARTVGTSI